MLRSLVNRWCIASTALVLIALPLQMNADGQANNKEITNTIGMKLAHVPPGKFTMGSPVTEKNRDDENENEHEVEITKGFFMGKYEVTIAEFRRFVETEGYKTEAEKDGQGGYGYDVTSGEFEGRKPKYTWKNTGWVQGDLHPVVNVSWNDARAFCGWLSRHENKTYDLPTEAHWEYACRAGAKTAYASGDDPETLAQVGNVADAAFREKLPKYKWGIAANDGHAFTAPVGQFRANAFGLHDMHGNASEWCRDWYREDYYVHSPPQEPPGGQFGTSRVLRGGSFINAPAGCRSANRNYNSPAGRNYNIGFRVVLVD